ncbi:TetR/AcrR family transcriptional regulator [Bacillus sp. FJAT-22090]|uniref:TetR/AcrR family transcriptional regulator n=1 Tax=Bacillus sp. FJAT-22090 TaxID=1581038 RepID=UPI0011A950DE|nr:TetR/AcrR family transcriptional regulator [Bacillus sp. FJAT-22090]
MDQKKVDRRITKTRKVIRDAFTQLMEEKGFEAITVSDLTEKADINRGTFYLHYKDKYDLLEQSEEEVFEKLDRIAEEAWTEINSEELNKKQIHIPLPFTVKLFEYLEENSAFMRVILGPNGDPSFQAKLKEVIKNKMFQKFYQFNNKDNMIVPLDYLTAYVSSAHLGVIQYWLKSGMDKSPEEMATILSQTTFWGPAKVAGLTFNDINE